jgi:tetratricopeptide (TPR) repeat protein
MHELLRQYAADRLDASPDDGAGARDRHCAFYTSALEAWGEDLKSARSQEALAEMRADRENIRVAWEWAVDHRQVERLDQIMGNLAMFLYREGRHREGEAASRRASDTLAAMAAVSPDHPEASRREGERLRVMAKTLAMQGAFNHFLGRKDARQLLDQALAELDKSELIGADTREERANITFWLGHVALNTGEHKAARSRFEESLALYRALGDDFFSSAVLTKLGDVAQDQGAHAEAKQLYEESLALARALGEQFDIGFSLQRLSRIASAQGQLEEAERLARECVRIFQKLGSRFDAAGGLNYLGWAVFWQGRFAEAQSTFEQSVADLDDLGLRRYVYMLRSILGLGQTELGLGRYKRAGEQGQRCLALACEADARWEVGQSLALLGAVALAEGTFDKAQNLFREGATVFQESGSPEAVAWFATWLSFADWGTGQTRVAREHLCEGLRTIIEHQYYLPLVPALSATALLLADEGHAYAEQAVELYALASRYGYVGTSRWFEDVIGEHIAAVAATLPPDVVAAAQERGRARDLWATAQELLEQLQRPDRFPTNPVRS